MARGEPVPAIGGFALEIFKPLRAAPERVFDNAEGHADPEVIARQALTREPVREAVALLGELLLIVLRKRDRDASNRIAPPLAEWERGEQRSCVRNPSGANERTYAILRHQRVRPLPSRLEIRRFEGLDGLGVLTDLDVENPQPVAIGCLLYTSDAADE